MDKLQTLLAVCGGISVIGGAAIMVYRFITPALRLNKRIKILERHQTADYERLATIEDMQCEQNRALAALLNHQIDGNGVENMKKIRDNLLKSIIEK